jgi:hypothetical protein
MRSLRAWTLPGKVPRGRPPVLPVEWGVVMSGAPTRALKVDSGSKWAAWIPIDHGILRASV